MKIKLLMLLIVGMNVQSKLQAQNDLSNYLDSAANKDTFNYNIINDKCKKDTVEVISKSDSLKNASLKKFEREKYENNEPFVCLYLLKTSSVHNQVDFQNIHQQGFPLNLSLNFSQGGFFMDIDGDALYYLGWSVGSWIYGGGGYVESKKFNLSSQFLGINVGGMLSLEKTDKKRVGPGLFWGAFLHNNAVIQQTFGGAFSYQYMTRNSLPVQFKARVGAGVIDVSNKKSKLMGRYWEISSHVPIKFTKSNNDAAFYVSPYILYCKIPYYEDYKYKFTPSTFTVGVKFGVGFKA
jgi:hypothetical protein